MNVATTGLSEGDFHRLHLLYNGVMQDIVPLLGGGGSGSGTVSSATLPLSISNGVLSIDLSAYSTTSAINTLLANYALASSLSNYIQTTHESNKIGSADLVHGAYDIETRTLTLKNASGVTGILSVDNGGNINIGADAVLTVPALNAWEFLTMSFKDSSGTVRALVPSQTGTLVYGGVGLADLNQLATKQDVLTAGDGVFLNANTLSTYTLRWNDTSTPVSGNSIQELHWDGYNVTETANFTTNKVELTIGHPTDMATQTWATSQLAAKQNALTAGTGISIVGNTISATGGGGGITSVTGSGDITAVTSSGAVAITADATLARTSALAAYQPLLTGVTQAGSGVSLETIFASKLTLDASTHSNTSQCNLLMKFGSSQGSYCFSNANYWGWIPDAGQTLRFYSATGYTALEVSSTSATVTIPGTLNVSGTKNFLIPHPDPARVPEAGKAWKLRHSCIESDLPLLVYRVRVDMTSTTQTFEMPSSWFPFITRDAWVTATPHKHFGSAWGEVAEDGYTFTLHATTLGEWNVLITALRDDHCGQMCAGSPIEFQLPLPADQT